jgi:hypothetical protein
MSIIQAMLEPQAEDITGKYQAGFWKGMSTIDLIRVMKQCRYISDVCRLPASIILLIEPKLDMSCKNLEYQQSNMTCGASCEGHYVKCQNSDTAGGPSFS